MAKKKDDGSFLMAIQLVGALALLPFIYYIFKHYKKLKINYPLTSTSQRIYNTDAAYAEFGSAAIIGALSWFIITFPASIIFDLISSKLLALIILLPFVYLISAFWLLPAAKSVAAVYFGVIVDGSRNLIALPKDGNSYSFLDHMKLIPLREQGEMEQIDLSSITKITRQGNSLFILGNFGSREINLGNRQKRDECIAAIQNATKTLNKQPEIESFAN